MKKHLHCFNSLQKYVYSLLFFCVNLDSASAQSTDLLSFSGNMMNHKVQLYWATATEAQPLQFTIERSLDGNIFGAVASLNSYNNGQDVNLYSFNDPDTIQSLIYYRLKITDDQGAIKYSSILKLNGMIQKSIAVNVRNPFDQRIHFNVTAPDNGRANVDLINLQGAVMRRREVNLDNGVNSIVIDNTDLLPAGIYILRIQFNGTVVQRKITKGYSR